MEVHGAVRIKLEVRVNIRPVSLQLGTVASALKSSSEEIKYAPAAGQSVRMAAAGGAVKAGITSALMRNPARIFDFTESFNDLPTRR